jgi:[ribosomal protein S18]-alanine N-acetyltransferase
MILEAARITVLVPPVSDADRDALLVLEEHSGERALSWDTLVAEATTDQGIVVVARDAGGRAVGFASARLLVDTVHVVRMVVEPARRRHGVGTLLLAALVTWSHEMGALELTLEVRASNAGARGLYGRFGMVEAGRRPRYYPDGEDALLLTLPLSTGSASGPLADDGKD